MTHRYKSRVRRAINKLVRARAPGYTKHLKPLLMERKVDPRWIRRHFAGVEP